MCGVSSMQLFRSSSDFNSIGQSSLSQEERRTQQMPGCLSMASEQEPENIV